VASGALDTYYYYNGEGELTQMWYPTTVGYGPGGAPETSTRGPIYNYSYDSMYRLSGMTMEDPNNNITTVVNNVSYNAANQLLGMTFNNISESRQYNTLGQLTSLQDALATSPFTAYVGRTYTYPTGTNNGKISSMSDSISGETVTYAYDSLKRLVSASGTIQQTLQWDQSYVFDHFGNLLQKNIVGGILQQPSTQLTVNTANNWITSVSGLSYDANGNALTSGVTYDVENHMTAGGYYTYDGQNERIAAINTGNYSCNPVPSYTIIMYSPSGQKFGDYTFSPQYWQEDSVWWMETTASSSSQ